MRPYIRFPVENPSGRDVLETRGLSKSWDDPIFSELHLKVSRGDKVAILGRNGIGKTTLVKALLGQIEIDAGTSRWGHNTSVGYFAENHREEIQAGSTVYEWLFSHRPEVGSQDVRAILGRMLFSGSDGAKPTGTLSGGEAARLMMCNWACLGMAEPAVATLERVVGKDQHAFLPFRHAFATLEAHSPSRTLPVL